MATTAIPTQRFLDPRILGRLSNLQLVAKTVVEGFLIGLHRSPYYGVSIDFAEYRPYSPGDDPRSIDWNVFARTDRYYLKKYHGETNAEVHIILDASASMGYKSGNREQGTGNRSATLTKFEYACYLAASLAYLAIHQRDAVGLTLFDTDLQDHVPSRTRRGQLPYVLHMLDRARPGKGTDFAGPLRKAMQFLRRRGIVILISDFYEAPEKVMHAVRGLQFGGNDLVLFHILDPGELQFPVDAPVQLEDMETTERLEVVPESAAEQYRSLLQQHIQTLQHECRSSRIDYTMLDTSRPLDYALFTFLSARARSRM
ncbi:MAG: DUF58 domain-containing protein [Acidobacteria bacterium]|nr:DUF58 domain-containing protein [Acidobacteriota bacterium]